MITEIVITMLASIAGFQVVELLMEIGNYFTRLKDTYLRYCDFKPFNCDYCMSHWVGLLLALSTGANLPLLWLLICWWAGARIGYFMTKDFGLFE